MLVKASILFFCLCVFEGKLGSMNTEPGKGWGWSGVEGRDWHIYMCSPTSVGGTAPTCKLLLEDGNSLETPHTYQLRITYIFCYWAIQSPSAMTSWWRAFTPSLSLCYAACNAGALSNTPTYATRPTYAPTSTYAPPPTYTPCKYMDSIVIASTVHCYCLILYTFGQGWIKFATIISFIFSGNLDCQNNGSCVLYDFGSYCFCPAGYTGERCQTRELESLPLHIS